METNFDDHDPTLEDRTYFIWDGCGFGGGVEIIPATRSFQYFGRGRVTGSFKRDSSSGAMALSKDEFYEYVKGFKICK
jgi:hypothetical protein